MRPFIFSLIALTSLASSALSQTAAPSVAPAAQNTAIIIPEDSSRDNHFAYTKERFKKYMASLETAPRPINLIFDGDSITDGWQGPGREVWAKNFSDRRAFDFGVSGDRTQHLLWRLSKGQVTGLDPKLVALMIGTNNLGANSAEQIAEGIKTIVAEYQKLNPNAVILLQAIFPRGQSLQDPARAKIKEINKLISTLADGKKVIYIDFGDKFLEPDGTLSAEIMPDFLHPSAKGYEIWVEAIKPIIDQYCPAS